jgi:hypothetical protein
MAKYCTICLHDRDTTLRSDAAQTRASVDVSVSETHFTNLAVRNKAGDMRKHGKGPAHTSFQRVNNKYQTGRDGGVNAR